MKTMHKLLFFSAILGCTIGASAQAAFDRHASNVALLQVKTIQKELGVTEAQRAKMNQAAAAFNKEMTAVRKAIQDAASQKKQPPATLQKRAEAALAKMNSSVLAQLSVAQLKRLREISLQAAGTGAMGDQTIANRVGLKPTQVKQIRSIFETAIKKAAELEQREMDAAMKAFRDRKPKDAAEAKKLMEQAQKKALETQKRIAPQSNRIRLDAEAKVIALLDSKQKQAWSALLGKKFAGPITPPNPS